MGRARRSTSTPDSSSGPGRAPEEDEVLVALDAVVAALGDCTRHIASATRGAEVMRTERAAGASYADILGSADEPLVVELMSAVLGTLSETGSRLRRAQARALYAEGLSMDKIAGLFGVSRQRVSSLLRPPSGTERAAVPRARPRRGSHLALTEPELRVVAEALPHIAWVAAADGATEYVNGQCIAYTGLGRDANDEWRWVDLVHPDDAERARVGWAEATRSETPFALDYRIRRADGEYRWHAFRASPIRGGDGYVTTWLGTATDIDDLRLRELTTTDELRLLEALHDGAPVGFGVLDRDLQVVRMNPRLAEIAGVPAADQVGRPVEELAPAIWPELARASDRVLRTGEPVVDLTLTGETAADPGRPHRWLASCYPIRTEGAIAGLGLVVVDVT